MNDLRCRLFPILKDMKAKYAPYLRPEITEVLFGQTADRCYLEIHIAELFGGYLKDEKISRTDLAFITTLNLTPTRLRL